MNKKYLDELINEIFPDWRDILEHKNLIINAPCGAGKTYFTGKSLFIDQDKKYLYLCNTKNLEDSVLMSEDIIATTYNDNYTFKKGERVPNIGRPNIRTMTFAGFGKKIQDIIKVSGVFEQAEYIKKFISQFDTIVVDEAHALIDYKNIYSKDTNVYRLTFESLCRKNTGTKIIWMTATTDILKKEQDKYENLFKDFELIKFDEKIHPIKHYSNKRLAYIYNYSDVVLAFKEYKGAFKDFYEKTLIYTSQISNMKKIEEIANTFDYLTPICIWSLNANEPMTNEQLQARNDLLLTGKIDDKYNVLIINDASLEGINIKDKGFTIAIVNSMNKTVITQARGRIRNDIDLLILRTDDKDNKELLNKHMKLNKKYLDKWITKEELNEVIDELFLKDEKGRKIGVRAIEEELNKLGFSFERKRKKIEGKLITLYYISKK